MPYRNPSLCKYHSNAVLLFAPELPMAVLWRLFHNKKPKNMKEQMNVAEIMVSYKPTNCNNPIVTRSQDAYRELIEFFPDELIHLQEQFVVMYLNRAKRIIGIYRLSKEGITGTVAYPKTYSGNCLKSGCNSYYISSQSPFRQP